MKYSATAKGRTVCLKFGARLCSICLQSLAQMPLNEATTLSFNPLICVSWQQYFIILIIFICPLKCALICVHGDEMYIYILVLIDKTFAGQWCHESCRRL